jgi:hypothetical protein
MEVGQAFPLLPNHPSSYHEDFSEGVEICCFAKSIML